MAGGGGVEDQKSIGEDPEFLCGVAVNTYQNSGKVATVSGILSAQRGSCHHHTWRWCLK